MWYFKIQILLYDDKESLKKQTSDLSRFCQYFDLSLVGSPHYSDSFYIALPRDSVDACVIMNALNAYFYFYDIAHRINFDDSDGPLDDIVNEIDEIFVEGKWVHKTKNS